MSEFILEPPKVFNLSLPNYQGGNYLAITLTITELLHL